MMVTKRTAEKLEIEFERQMRRHEAAIEERMAVMEERTRMGSVRDETTVRRIAIVAEVQGDLDEEGEKELKTEVRSSMLN